MNTHHYLRICLLTLAAAMPTWAGFFSSSTIEVDHYYPTLGAGSVTAQPSTWTSPQFTAVLNTASATPTFHVYSDFNFTDTTVTFTLPGTVNSPFVFNTVPENTIRFYDSANAIPNFGNVTVAATGGLNLASLLTFDNNAIDINFQSVSATGNVVTITIAGASSTPEPATCLMLGLGLAGLALARKR